MPLTPTTPAEKAVWTPPQGQTMGVLIPGTIVSPFTKNNIPDTLASRLTIAFWASRPKEAQVLASGRVGAYMELAYSLDSATQKSTAQKVQALDVPLLLWTDFYGMSIDSVTMVLNSQGATSISYGSATIGVTPPVGSFPLAMWNKPKTKDDPGSFDVTCYPPADWAIELLTTAPKPGETNPIGVYVGGLNVNGSIAQEGQINSYYAQALGDNRMIGSEWPESGPPMYFKTYMPGGQANADAMGGISRPIIWMQIGIPAA